MNEQRAREVLRDFIEADASLTDDGNCWVWWKGGGEVEIDGALNADELEAMAWWLRNKRPV